MIRKILVIAVVTLLCGCSIQEYARLDSTENSGSAPMDETSPVSAQNTVLPGMTYEEVMDSMGNSIQSDFSESVLYFNTGDWKDWAGKKPADIRRSLSCGDYEFVFEGKPEEEKLNAIIIFSPQIKTFKGLSSTDSIERVIQKYGEPQSKKLDDEEIELEYYLPSYTLYFRASGDGQNVTFWGIRESNADQGERWYKNIPDGEEQLPFFHGYSDGSMDLKDSDSTLCSIKMGEPYKNIKKMMNETGVVYQESIWQCSPYTISQKSVYDNFREYWDGAWLRILLQNDNYVIQCDGEIPCVSAVTVISPNIASNNGVKAGWSQEQVENIMGAADFTYEKEEARVLQYKRGNHFFKVYLENDGNGHFSVYQWGIDAFVESQIHEWEQGQNTIFQWITDN